MTTLPPIVVEFRRIPGSDLAVGAAFLQNGYVTVLLSTKPVAEMVGAYHPRRLWQIPGTEDGMEPWARLKDAVTNSAWYGTVFPPVIDGEAFWRRFVHDVEEAFPVADVMLR